jgi:ubiquinone/menaquinone biosynthesis C-methylase UbiE
MVTDAGSGGPTFKEQELAGWDAKANAYDDYAGRITTQIVKPLLDAAGVKTKTALLDIACGPGYLAGAAAERGANAVGIDFAPSMVREARKNFPDAEFRYGDAEALQFESESFDAVVCGFGLGHLPEPDKALLEAFRVLRPGGRYAFSWWCTPDKHEFFALVMGAVKAHGTLEVPLPPAPSMFRFSDPIECKRALSSAGFSDVEVQEHALRFEPQSPQQGLDLISKSSVRMAMVLELQTKEALARIHEAILVGLQAYKRKSGFRIGWPALVVSGRKRRSKHA